MWQSQPSRTEHRVKVVDLMEASRIWLTSVHRSHSLKCTWTMIRLFFYAVFCNSMAFILPLVHTQTSFMLRYYWIIAYPVRLLCLRWPGMALCETPSWECPWINLGLAQDCPGLLGDGGGLAVTACFGGVRAIGRPNCPWLKLREQEADATTPTVEPPATRAILRI